MAAAFDRLADVTALDRPLHLAVGMFDGVHVGHRAVIESAVHSARRSGGLCGVLTFWPHPSFLFRPEAPTPQLTDAQTKRAILEDLGVELVITEPFTPEFAAMAAEDFLPHLRRYLPRLTAVYVGENWRYGRGRAGDVALLVKEGSRLGIKVYSAPRVSLDGEPISSTRIRGLLEAGDLPGANAALGYRYFAVGPVMPGQKLGRKIGFPTLNLPWAPGLRPRHGVYRVRVRDAAGGALLSGVANYGLRPTVSETLVPLLEVHLLDHCPWKEGDVLHVEWLEFLRDEQEFESVEALKAQIARDVALARERFAAET